MLDLDEIGAAQLRRYCWLRGINDKYHSFNEYPGGKLQRQRDAQTLLDWAMANLPCIPASDKLLKLIERNRKRRQ